MQPPFSLHIFQNIVYITLLCNRFMIEFCKSALIGSPNCFENSMYRCILRCFTNTCYCCAMRFKIDTSTLQISMTVLIHLETVSFDTGAYGSLYDMNNFLLLPLRYLVLLMYCLKYQITHNFLFFSNSHRTIGLTWKPGLDCFKSPAIVIHTSFPWKCN